MGLVYRFIPEPSLGGMVQKGKSLGIFSFGNVSSSLLLVTFSLANGRRTQKPSPEQKTHGGDAKTLGAIAMVEFEAYLGCRFEFFSRSFYLVSSTCECEDLAGVKCMMTCGGDAKVNGHEGFESKLGLLGVFFYILGRTKRVCEIWERWMKLKGFFARGRGGSYWG